VPKIKILVVEDESLVAWNVKNMLINLGYEVAGVVSTGEKALQKAEETGPHLVLMDIVLKGTTDGITTAGKIMTDFGIPVVYLTAYADETTLQRAKVTKPFGYLLKPFDEKELQSTIEMALYKSQMEKVLSERERWLSTVLRSIGDAVMATDHEGRVTFMNPVAEELTGRSQEESIREPLNAVLALRSEGANTPIKIRVKEIIRLGHWPLPQQSYLRAKNGGEVPIDLNAAFIRDEKEEATGIVLVFRDITERKQHEEKLNFLAIHDSLTGLPNRALFNDHLALAISNARRTRHRVVLMMLDLDRFKKVNDSMGHDVGDRLLRAVGERLLLLRRQGDTVARLSGDEFMLLCPDVPEPEAATEIALRMLASFEEDFSVGGSRIHITASIGLSLYPDDGRDPEDLIKKADMAMYGAKEAGRNTCQRYSSGMRPLALE
jgi:diguanylate cyclase (GGDEF)-like protein/PAS domain S-box-containing protein